MEDSIKPSFFSKLLEIFRRTPQICCVTPQEKLRNVQLAEDDADDNSCYPEANSCNPCPPISNEYECSPDRDDCWPHCNPCNPCFPCGPSTQQKQDEWKCYPCPPYDRDEL